MNAQTKAALAAVTERVERLQYQHDSLGVKSIKGVYTYSRGDASIHLEGCKQTIKEVLAILRDIAAGGEVPVIRGVSTKRLNTVTPNPAAKQTGAICNCMYPYQVCEWNCPVCHPKRNPASKRGGE